MKKNRKYLLSLMLGAISLTGVNAQASGYSFTPSAGTYTPLTGGVDVDAVEGDFSMSADLPIGFTFNFDGNDFTTFRAGSDGIISFATGAGNTGTNDLDNTAASRRPLVAPLWDDNDGNSTGAPSQASYLLSGTAPNRVLTFEWLNWEWRWNSSTPTVSFQVKLYETSNLVEFVYEQGPGAVSFGTASIGLTGVSTFLSLDGTGAAPNASSVTESANLSAVPATGQVYAFLPPSCVGPGALATSNLTANSSDFTWTQSGATTDWIVESGASGFTPSATAVNATVTPTYSETGLTPATDYDFYVRAVCAPGDTSNWSGPFSFTTPCLTLSAPWTEGFENSGSIPTCWTMAGGEPWLFNTSGPNNVGANGTLSGSTITNSHYATVDASQTAPPAELYSPMIDVSSLSYPRLSFYEISIANAGQNSQLEVEVWDGAAWNAVGLYNTNTVGWELKEILLYGITFTGDAQVRFTFSEVISPNSFSDDIAIDDVTIDEGPSCPNPTDLVVTYPDNDSAVVNWTLGYSETLWNLEVGVLGFAPGTGAEVYTYSGMNDYDTITGLLQLTDYDVYVQADCGVDSSIWVGPITFTTLPNCPDVSGIVTTPLMQDSVVLSWTSNGTETMWDYEYGPAGFVPGSGTVVPVTATNDTITGLMSGTQYDFYVRSDCGGSDQGIWVGPFSYTTTCFTLAPTTLPFFEDFEALTGTSVGDQLMYCGPDKIWDFSTTNQGLGRIQYGTNTYAALAGTGSMSMDVSANGTFAANTTDLTLDLSAYSSGMTGIGLSFLIAEYGDEVHAGDMIWVRGSNLDPWITVLGWNTVTNFTNAVLIDNINLTLLMANAGQVPSSTFQLRFGQEDNFSFNSDGVIFDNILIEEVPCFAPVAAAQVYAVADTLVVGWTVNGTETEWNVEYGPVGFTPGTGTFFSTTNNPDTITGLPVGTAYDYYVQAACSVTDSSAWYGPTVVATEVVNDFTCDAVFVPSDGTSGYFSNIGASQQPGEPFNGNGHSVWFKTVVPASGHLAIGTCGNDANTQLSTYSYHVDCTDSLWMNNFDNTTFNPWGCDLNSPAGNEFCGLVAGDTVYFSISTFGADAVFPVTAWDLQYEAGTGAPITVCVGDSVNVAAQISGATYQYTGFFDYLTNPAVIVNDSIAATANFTFGNDTILFIVDNTCMADTAYALIEAVSAPNPGVAMDPFDGCNTGDVYLMGGLTGTVDAGGTWSDDDATGLLVGNIYVAATQPTGAYNFTYTVDNGICPTESTSVTVTLNDCVGIDESVATFGLFPNPNNGTFSISSNVTEVATLQVLDAQGKVVYNKQVNLTAGVSSDVQLANVTAGIYMVRLQTENSVSVQNIMVK